MEEISGKSKSLWIQFIFIFGWLGLIVFLSTLDGGKDADKMTDLMTPGVMRLSALIQDLLIFITPVLFFVFIFRKEKFSFLTLRKKIHPLWLLSAIFVIFFSVPFIAWIGEVNAGIKIPASMSGMENWMKSKEETGSKLTELLLNDRSTSGIFLNLFIMAFLAAFSEELFFRGVIQKLFVELKMNYHVAIWLAAIIFSAFHMQFYGFLPRTILGACIGYLFYFTGNLWISIIAHFINNALYIVIAYASENIKVNPLEQSTNDPATQMSWPMVALSVLLVGGVFIFLKKMKEKENSTEI